MYVSGLTSSALIGPPRILQWTSEFTSELVRSILCGKTYAFSEMVGNVGLRLEIYAHLRTCRRE